MSKYQERTVSLSTKQATRSPFPVVHARVLHLDGKPVTADQPLPTLRRTASGYLYQPEVRTHSCEKCNPRPVTPPSNTVQSVRFYLSPGHPFGVADGTARLKDGPARRTVVVDRFRVSASSQQRTSGGCENSVMLKRKGRLVVDREIRRSLKGVVESMEAFSEAGVQHEGEEDDM